LDLQKPKEPEFVSLADAVPNPWAVMIMRGYAMVALLAMFASQRLFNMANCTVLIFNKEHDSVIIFNVVDISRFQIVL
jgi:hypothetical protein